MSPTARVKGDSLFLIDVDNVEGEDIMGLALAALAECGAEIVKQYATKNGWHIITKPFNPTTWNGKLGEIKKDGLILLAW